MSAPARSCPVCGMGLLLVHVHGHGQCAHCGSNVEPCCAGSGAGDAQAASDGAPESLADPAVFARVFSQLGGEGATVTRDALQFALGQWLGIGLEEAAIVITAGLHVGKLAPAGELGYRLAADGR